MLKLTLKAGQYVTIGNDIKVVYTGGGVGNAQFLIDAPKSMNIARSNVLEREGMIDPGNETKYYKNKDISPEAKVRIKTILMEERKKNKREEAQES